MEKFKLLLVDDEQGVRNAIARMVDWESIDVEICGTANDGVEALQKIEELQPDILLIDIRMPQKSGLEVIAEIDCHDDWIIKSVVLSGYDQFSYAQTALRLGAVDYLLKPCLPEDILKAIQKAKEQVKIQQKQIGEANKNETTGHKFVDAAIEYIHENYKNDITLISAAESVFLSPGYLSTLFKKYTGEKFIDYLHMMRLEKACELLKNSLKKAYEIAHDVGYKDERYFTRVFKRQYGISPSEFRKKG